MKTLTQERLKQLLRYEPETGNFFWLERPAQKIQVGDEAGYVADSGYVLIGVCGQEHRAHRLAFLWMIGAWPQGEVDHKNRIRNDNRWANLRDVTHSQNQQNSDLRTDNKSGQAGVYLETRTNKWAAKLAVEKRDIWLGRHATKEAAIAAYLAAKAKYHTPIDEAKSW